MGEAPVDDVWSCEAARSLELGAEERRSLALFAAYDDGQLEQVLASTPPAGAGQTRSHRSRGIQTTR